MNISSAIIKTKPNRGSESCELISQVKGCEIHLQEEEKIIITIEAENISEEIAIIRTLEQIDSVITAEIAFAFSEEELEAERTKLEMADPTPSWLNEELDAKQIRYGGDLRKKAIH